jgi:ribosomal protein S18 acetylase RimI-like enzyme
MTWYRTYGTFEATPYLYLDDIYVRAEFRRRGIAKTFLRHLARRARDEGAARIDWIVLDWNAPAIAFYRGIGAKLADEWRICRLSGEALERIAQ